MGIAAEWKKSRAAKNLRRVAKEDAINGMPVDQLMEKHQDKMFDFAATMDAESILAETERLTREWGTPEDVAILRLAAPYMFLDFAHLERANAHYSALTQEQLAIVEDCNTRQLRISERILAHRREEAAK